MLTDDVSGYLLMTANLACLSTMSTRHSNDQKRVPAKKHQLFCLETDSGYLPPSVISTIKPLVQHQGPPVP